MPVIIIIRQRIIVTNYCSIYTDITIYQILHARINVDT